MRALLLLLLIYINYAISINETKYSFKVYPKKVKPGHLQLINTGKYKKASLYNHKSLKYAKKRSPDTQNYTAFPFDHRKEIEEKANPIPNPPNFAEESVNIKPRVKKVLPDYVWTLRRKRSAVSDDPKPDNAEETKIVLDTKAEVSTNAENTVKVEVTTANVDQLPKNSEANTIISKATETPVTTLTNKVSKDSIKDKPVIRSRGNNQKKNTPIQNTKAKVTKAKGKKTTKPVVKKTTNKNKTTKPGRLIKTSKPKAATSPVKPAKKLTKQTTRTVFKRFLDKTKNKPIKNVKSQSAKMRSPKKAIKNPARVQPNKKIAQQASRKSSIGRVGKTNKSKQNRRKDTRRLIASRDALIEDYPYVVSIQKDYQHWCAGALLNPRLVITTANCMWKSSRISRMEIRAGSRHVDHGGQMASISEVMKHPGWGIRKQPDNDVALVLLDRNLRFSDTIHSVDLPNRVMMPAFDDAWITSWGAERRDGVYDPKPTSLQAYHARLMDRDKCNNVTQRFGVRVTENFICLAQTGKRAPCTRDTGAPAVSDGVLWGMASWGIRKLCGTERFPAMFSYVASQTNMDFIMNATRYLMSDKRYYPYLDRLPEFRASSPSVPSEPSTF